MPDQRIDLSNLPIPELKRYKLRMHILRSLHKKEMQSAASLAKKINVSLPTVRSALDELISQKIVNTSGTGDSSGGRKPLVYSLQEDAFYIVAIEMGHLKSKGCIMDCHDNYRTKIREIETHIDDPELEEKIDEALITLLKEAGLGREKITAVGIGMPGLVDSTNGVNRTIKDPAAQNIRDRISNRIKIRTIIGNDARMQALGEFVFGKAKNSQNTLVVNWNWGLGLGIIINGEIYKGSNGCSGEFSHIRMVENGTLCECGKRGCLQTIAGIKHLIEMAREEVARDTTSQLTKAFKGKINELTHQDIVRFAKKGDELCISLLNKLSTSLGWGLSILIQLYNPELIVLSGPLVAAGQYVLIPVQQAINQYCLTDISGSIRIEASEAGEKSGLNGISIMVFNRLFRDKSLEL